MSSNPLAPIATQEACVRRFLDLLTAHIAKTTNDALCQAGTIDIIYVPHAYGFWVYVPTEIEPEEMQRRRVPGDLAGLMRYARERDCDWILLDADGVTVEGLPSFDW